MRRILGSYLRRSPESLVYREAEGGKPELVLTTNEPPLRFNLSHSKSIALLAVCLDSEIGVDVEDIRPIERDVATRFFSPAEIASMAPLDGEAWFDAFYRCWTRKEAILKVEGMGLRIPLDSFDVSVLADEPADLLAVRPKSKLNRPLASAYSRAGRRFNGRARRCFFGHRDQDFLVHSRSRMKQSQGPSAAFPRSWIRLDGVDLLRGLAILFVLMNHVNMRLLFAHVPYTKGLPDQLVSSLVWDGQYGVQIFFAVSGFLITSTALRRWGRCPPSAFPTFTASASPALRRCSSCCWPC